VTAVHVANVLADELEAAADPERTQPPLRLASEHLERIGVADRLAGWRALAATEAS
jgi:hypothetical protein